MKKLSLTLFLVAYIDRERWLTRFVFVHLRILACLSSNGYFFIRSLFIDEDISSLLFT